MNQQINKAIAKISGLAIIASQLVIAAPAHAAVTESSDTMSAALGASVQQINATAVTHIVSIDNDADVTGTVTMTYPGFSAFSFVSGTCTGGTIADGGTATNVVDFDITGTCGAGTFVIEFTGTNPATAGSYPVTVAGDADIAGTHFAVPITDEDQISVTASVDPYITFDLEASTTNCDSGSDGNANDHTPNAGAYTVAFGTISPTQGKSSDASGVEHICTTVSTNAGDGYSLSVRSTNGGLFNAGTGQYINDEATETAGVTAGTDTNIGGQESYGMCLLSASGVDMDTTLPAGQNLTAAGDFAQGTCTGVNTTETFAKLTTSTQTIGGNTDPVQEGTAQWLLKTSIAATTGAGSYTDTLTFVATGTF